MQLPFFSRRMDYNQPPFEADADRATRTTFCETFVPPMLADTVTRAEPVLVHFTSQIPFW